MKTIAAILAAATLLACGGTASGFGLLGPPVPEARPDRLSLSIGYENDKTKWKAGSAAFDKVSLSRNQAYLQVLDTSIGFTERGAGFLRVGAANLDDGASFDAGYKPFGSLGMKDVWYVSRGGSLKLGSIFLAGYCPGYEAEKTLSTGTVVKAKVKTLWDVGLGIALQAAIGERLSLYGGPLLVYGNAKVTREGGGSSVSTTYKEKDPVGGFAGIGLSLSDSLLLFVEAQYRSDMSAGASIAWSFK